MCEGNVCQCVDGETDEPPTDNGWSDREPYSYHVTITGGKTNQQILADAGTNAGLGDASAELLDNAIQDELDAVEDTWAGTQFVGAELEDPEEESESPPESQPVTVYPQQTQRILPDGRTHVISWSEIYEPMFLGLWERRIAIGGNQSQVFGPDGGNPDNLIPYTRPDGSLGYNTAIRELNTLGNKVNQAAMIGGAGILLGSAFLPDPSDFVTGGVLMEYAALRGWKVAVEYVQVAGKEGLQKLVKIWKRTVGENGDEVLEQLDANALKEATEDLNKAKKAAKAHNHGKVDEAACTEDASSQRIRKGAKKLSAKAKDLLDGKDVRVGSIKEADELLKEALPNARKVTGTGPGQSGPPDWTKFKGKDPNGIYHKDYHFDPETQRIYGHGPGNPHALFKHINIKLPDGRKVTIFIEL